MLNPQQKRELVTDGYTIVRGAVPRVMIDAARKAINQCLGDDGIPPEQLPTYRAQSYCPQINRTPVMIDLFEKTPLRPMVESAFGTGNLLPVEGVQIALRFPNTDDPAKPPRGHLDGIGTDVNGIPKGQFRRGFTALVTLLLVDLPDVTAGNFTVWPGSHIVAEKFFQEATPDELKKGMPELDLPREPVMITGDAGDAVISHHQLVHGAAPNASPNIRYAAIFRARHKDVKANGTDVMTDIWREWPGLVEEVQTLL